MKALSRTIFAAVALLFAGCAFSLEYTTPKGTAIGGTFDPQTKTVTLGASREAKVDAKGRPTGESFGVSTSFKLPNKKGLAK